MLISRWQLYSDQSCSSEGIFAIYSIFAYGLYPWLPAELIVTRQLIHFGQSIRKLLPRKCLQQQPTHSYRPETFCSTPLLHPMQCVELCFQSEEWTKNKLLKPHETQLSILTSSTILLKSVRRVLQCFWGIECVGVHIMSTVGECTLSL